MLQVIAAECSFNAGGTGATHWTIEMLRQQN
jgi:hypothetical protein